MGLNVYFVNENGVELSEDNIQDFSRYNLQITHNLNKILIALDKKSGNFTMFYETIWRADELLNVENGKIPVKEILCRLTAIIESLIFNEKELSKHLPENGYGTYRGLIKFLTDYLYLCYIYKDYYIYLCR